MLNKTLIVGIAALSTSLLMNAIMPEIGPHEVIQTVQVVSVPQVAVALDPKQHTCLALNIYFEARNQPEVGALAVGHVVMNRVASKRYPNTICEVVNQGRVYHGRMVRHKCQFSWQCDGKSDNPRSNRAWNAAKILARMVMTGQSDDVTRGALWYHADYVNPYWAKSFKPTGMFGQHIFYKEN